MFDYTEKHLSLIYIALANSKYNHDSSEIEFKICIGYRRVMFHIEKYVQSGQRSWLTFGLIVYRQLMSSLEVYEGLKPVVLMPYSITESEFIALHEYKDDSVKRKMNIRKMLK